MNDKKNVELSNDGLENVAGGARGTVNKLEYDKACSSFICTECKRDHSHHKIERDELHTEWVYTYDGTNWVTEWRDHQLDCNHCKYFTHLNWAYGRCDKDANN